MKSLGNPHVLNSSLVAGIVWRKSSRSPNNGGSCVEAGVWRNGSCSDGGIAQSVDAALTADQVAIRDSKNPTGPLLAVAGAQWLRLLEEIKRDGFS